MGILSQITQVQNISWSGNVIQTSIYFLHIVVKYSHQHPAKVDTWTRLLYFARNKIPAAQLCIISEFNILAWFCGQMGHKTKGIGGVVLCSSCCDGEKKRVKKNNTV